ncbi:MAG: phosphatidylinositol-specific phospholipase C/glycerophosphodiester phosphodiesterase family protein [Prevotellaceae bacterium]|jgi:alkaline phosphatase|nr:phosphatidylinositol-specific phospholipase C/glycerophosphodiester phosphodiesterase family protein [Prevotellaceae bacterium]
MKYNLTNISAIKHGDDAWLTTCCNTSMDRQSPFNNYFVTKMDKFSSLIKTVCSESLVEGSAIKSECSESPVEVSATKSECSESFAEGSVAKSECSESFIEGSATKSECSESFVEVSAAKSECSESLIEGSAAKSSNNVAVSEHSTKRFCDAAGVAKESLKHLLHNAYLFRVAMFMFMPILLCGYLNAQPVKLHSHNDYNRRVPFYQAYSQQCASIEADVFTTERADELLVAHDAHDLPRAFTFDAMYIEPLLSVFRQNGGRAWRNSEQTLALVVDMKTPSDSTLPRVIKKLARYPEVFDPTVNQYAVRVVVSGNVPAVEQLSTYPAFIYFDGQLKDYSPQQLERVFMISLNLRRHTGWNGRDSLPDADREKISKLVEQAHAMGKPIRFWGAPDNANAWKILHELCVDIINTDRPEACAAFFNGEKW